SFRIDRVGATELGETAKLLEIVVRKIPRCEKQGVDLLVESCGRAGKAGKEVTDRYAEEARELLEIAEAGLVGRSLPPRDRIGGDADRLSQGRLREAPTPVEAGPQL